jgi:hypothetical protein
LRQPRPGEVVAPETGADAPERLQRGDGEVDVVVADGPVDTVPPATGCVEVEPLAAGDIRPEIAVERLAGCVEKLPDRRPRPRLDRFPEETAGDPTRPRTGEAVAAVRRVVGDSEAPRSIRPCRANRVEGVRLVVGRLGESRTTVEKRPGAVLQRCVRGVGGGQLGRQCVELGGDVGGQPPRVGELATLDRERLRVEREIVELG